MSLYNSLFGGGAKDSTTNAGIAAIADLVADNTVEGMEAEE